MKNPSPSSLESVGTTHAQLCENLEGSALSWLARRLSFFDPDLATADNKHFVFKTINELTLLVAYRTRLHGNHANSTDHGLRDWLERVLSRDSLRTLIARDHNRFFLYASLYSLGRAGGREDLALRAVIEQVLRTRHPFLSERIPYRHLDFLHSLYLADIPHQLPGFGETFAKTMFAGDPNVMEVDRRDAYAITHTAFYLTDFGLRAGEWGQSFDLENGCELVSALMRRYRFEGNADLVAELLAALLCMGKTQSPEIDRALKFLKEHQLPDGRIPGPFAARQLDPAMTAEENLYQEWRESYHTTIVVALAATMARRATERDGYPVSQQGRLGTVPAEVGARTGVPGINEAVGRAAHWFHSLLKHQDLSTALRAAAGMALCSHALPPGDDTLCALRELGLRLEALPDGAFLWETVGMDTLLLVAAVFRYAGIPCSPISEGMKVLAGEINHESIAGLASARATLQGLVSMRGFEPDSLRFIQRTRFGFEDALQAQAPANLAAQLLQHAAGDAKRLLLTDEELEAVGDALHRGLYEAFTAYRLGDMGVILRALTVLEGRQSRVVRNTVDYLLTQQLPHGAFGYFGQSSSESDPTGVQLHLYWTLSIVWTLTDFGFPGRSLFDMAQSSAAA